MPATKLQRERLAQRIRRKQRDKQRDKEGEHLGEGLPAQAGQDSLCSLDTTVDTTVDAAAPCHGQPARCRRLEMADVLRAGEAAFRFRYGDTLNSDQERVLREIPACRTQTMGGHSRECDDCGHTTYHYNSCNNRNCPQCGEQVRKDWYQRQIANILPVEYFHATFTLPQPLADLAADNPIEVYDTLFAAVAYAIQRTGEKWSLLQAKMAFTAVLHSWGELLNVHPHLHCLVPGGGVSLKNGQWVSLPAGTFLPEGELRDRYRRRYLTLLQRTYDKGELKLSGKLAHLRDPQQFAQWIDALYAVDWITYARPVGDGRRSIERTVKYLARYANRVAIANNRLVSCENGIVTFWYKDYRGNGGRKKRKQAKLPIAEFIRRYLQHVLANGKRHIHNYGFLANNQREEWLPKLRQQLGVEQTEEDSAAEPQQEGDELEGAGDCAESDHRCPACGQGQMIPTRHWPRPTVAELLMRPWRELNGSFKTQQSLFDPKQQE